MLITLLSLNSKERSPFMSHCFEKLGSQFYRFGLSFSFETFKFCFWSKFWPPNNFHFVKIFADKTFCWISNFLIPPPKKNPTQLSCGVEREEKNLVLSNCILNFLTSVIRISSNWGSDCHEFGHTVSCYLGVQINRTEGEPLSRSTLVQNLVKIL